MCVIQERMIAKNSNTTRLIDKLLLKDLVTSEVCPENRRKIEVLITEKGLQLLEELDPKVLENEKLFAANLNQKELVELNTLLEKYRNAKSILDSNKLSRGASEQLYLAFRLAVMQTNKRAPFIPAMFDDIAVNFDKTRFKSIVPIINEIAEKRQIFYFTCHEWVRDSLLTNTDAKLFTLT